MNRYEALKHAVKAHGTDTDWGGRLYVLHPIAVAERLDDPLHTEASTEDAVVVALLHDVLEDTDYELNQEWFTPEQWRALYLVTHKPEDAYVEYIEQIATDRLATMVKLADLSHNMSEERSEGLSLEQLKKMDSMREGRYLKARQRLWDALGVEWWPGA